MNANGKNAGQRFGVVAIGRNEGDRLKICLDSVISSTAFVVYVDSGSTDDSVAMAKARSAQVVNLDINVPFTAARARNAGLKRLLELAPALDFVQFVDGDCEVASGWLDLAATFLEQHDDVAVVCGRRRERFPDRTIYNKLCDIEWNSAPPGETRACGGDAMMRIDAFTAVNGYRAGLIAGEDPELCVRIRAAGWRIWRLDTSMTLHDAAMTKFSQWWRRTKRAGYAFAEGSWLHGAPPEAHYRKESQRALTWGVILPAAIILTSLLHPFFLLAALVYPLQVIRIALKSELKGTTAWWRALFLVLGRIPEGLGQINFYLNKTLRKKGLLIEYK